MSADVAIEPRLVKRGTLNETTGIYTLHLDNGAEVDTDSEEIATTASKAAKANRPLLIETEQRQGRSVITQLSLAPEAAPTKPEAAGKAEPPATRPKDQAIAKRPELPTGLINDPLKLTEQLQEMGKFYNVLSPMIAVSEMAPGFGVNLVVVKIDPTIVDEKTGRGTDTYYSAKIHKVNERAFSKNGLLKISQAFGIQWTQPRRVDTGAVRNYWHWQYFGYLRTYDGQQIPLTGSKELDLRDGSAEIEGMGAAQIKMARTFGNEICETKAMERAIRNLLRQTYTLQELDKPFLIPRSSFTPDMDDPEIKKLVTQQAMSGMGAMYPPPMPAQMPALAEPTVDAPDVSAAPAQTPPAKKNPFADAGPAAPADTLPDGTTTIAEVKPVESPRNAAKPWRRYDVVFANGVIASTFSQTIQQLVDDAYRQKAPVRITTSEREGYNDNLDKLEIVDKRQQKLPEDGGY